MSTARKISFVTLSLLLALAFAAVVTHADDMNQAMKLTFSQPIEIPSQVLPAGTYWFMLPDNGNGPQGVIQIFDGDRKHVIATLSVIDQTVPQPSGHVMLTLADRSPKPEALLNLTYPGNTEGHSFEVSYSKQQQDSFSEYPRVKMKVGKNGAIETSTADNTRP